MRLSGKHHNIGPSIKASDISCNQQGHAWAIDDSGRVYICVNYTTDDSNEKTVVTHTCYENQRWWLSPRGWSSTMCGNFDIILTHLSSPRFHPRRRRGAVSRGLDHAARGSMLIGVLSARILSKLGRCWGPLQAPGRPHALER